MLSKTITYEDFNGDTQTETHFFHISEAELMMKEVSETGGYTSKLKKLLDDLNAKTIITVIKDVIEMSYGRKSEDGKRFIKDRKDFEEFAQTEAYSELFMELLSDDNVAMEFVIGVLPKKLAERVRQAMNDPNAMAEVMGQVQTPVTTVPPAVFPAPNNLISPISG